jgi:hypothetical protein
MQALPGNLPAVNRGDGANRRVERRQRFARLSVGRVRSAAKSHRQDWRWGKLEIPGFAKYPARGRGAGGGTLSAVERELLAAGIVRARSEMRRRASGILLRMYRRPEPVRGRRSRRTRVDFSREGAAILPADPPAVRHRGSQPSLPGYVLRREPHQPGSPPRRGLLTEEEPETFPFSGERHDYAEVAVHKRRLLEIAYGDSCARGPNGVPAFRRTLNFLCSLFSPLRAFFGSVVVGVAARRGTETESWQARASVLTPKRLRSFSKMVSSLANRTVSR